MSKYIIQESAQVSELKNIQKTPLGTIRFVAVLQEANRVNRNKRIYPKDVLVEALNSAYVQEKIKTHSFFGEAGHPLDPSLSRQTTVLQTNLAFLVERFWWEGDLLMGLCETANTAVGRDMAGLIEQGSRVAFSLRAQGGVSKDPITGASKVDHGMQMIAYDWVITPSHDKAFMQEICSDTSQAMFGVTNVQENTKAVQQCSMLFESGQIFAVEDDKPMEIINEDFTAGYTKRLRSFEEIYFYNPGDQLIQESINGKTCEVKNGNVTKKVMLEDYMLQDLRRNICSLNESIDDRTNPSSILNKEEK